jgi:hypothetical protein
LRRTRDTPAAARLKAKAALKKKTLRLLKRARTEALKRGVELSPWEGTFLGSLEERVALYGRAFADPEKGAPGAPLSALQRRKLREIRAKIAEADAPPAPGERPETVRSPRRPFSATRPKRS